MDWAEKKIKFQISGRKFGYDRSLEIVQDEEYLEDVDFDEIRHSIYIRIVSSRCLLATIADSNPANVIFGKSLSFY